ncbi:hypothetical protein EMCG_04158 [[Emmonsia] crescens]|uniref:Uncharacterized protein n=1 Tax=[Emmonsia] crescens TaxID=73230 RepID=A0A0G2HT37_9EURO|nr:hypothetical protein EMCG_04158 [Emmonsia crescens UAMH 3008]
MRASLRPKERSCLADQAKKYTRLLLPRRIGSTLRSNPPRRITISSEYLNSPYAPDVCIHVFELASSSTTTLSIKQGESVLAKLKRHIHPLIWWKNADARGAPLGDEISIAYQSSDGYDDSQTQALNGKSSHHRTRFSFFRGSRRSQTEATPKMSTSSTSVDSMQQPPPFLPYASSGTPRSIMMLSQIRPCITRNTTFSAASTAEMEPADWPPLIAFPNSRLSGAHQIAVWQNFPSPIRTSTRHSDGTHNIEYGEMQLTLLERQYGKNQGAPYPVSNWLDGLPDPPSLRRIARVENLHELHTSHTI